MHKKKDHEEHEMHHEDHHKKRFAKSHHKSNAKHNEEHSHGSSSKHPMALKAKIASHGNHKAK